MTGTWLHGKNRLVTSDLNWYCHLYLHYNTSKVIYVCASFCPFVSSAFPSTCQKECWCSPRRLCKLQEIERKLWQQVNTLLLLCDVFFSHLLSCGRSHLLIYPFQSSVCHRDITCFPSTAQGVCCERGGGWRPGIFQCHAGDTTSLQIWEAAIRRHPGQPPRYIYVSDLRRSSPTQTLW